MEKKSIVPPTGEYNSWYSKFVLPQGLEGKVSSAGWTKGSEGFIQQTFLGASVRSFNVSAGFGDSASALSVELINDEYNKSDNTSLGIGDDVYHNGQYDEFAPPPVGSPVFFKFGKNFADVEQAWRKTFDDTYGYNTIEKITVTEKVFSSFDGIPPYHFYNLEKSKQTNQLYFEDMSDYYDPIKNHPGRGINHFVFGGILQSTTQNKSQEGNPLFSVQMVDPREILSNCSVILKNYAGSIFGNKNFFNVFGFLEHDVSDALKANIETKRIQGFSTGPIATAENWFTTTPFAAKTHNNLEKVVDPSNGNIFYYGNDVYRFPKPMGFVENEFPEFFPMTGQGFARVSDQGIPWYRVRQALEALFGYNGALPQEYIDAGYGGPINFRGFNYVADFSGIPLEKIPQMYFLDYEKIDLLSLAQELCETISHDMFVSLLPIIDHPACKFLYDYNNYWIQEALKFDEGSIDRNLRLGKVISGIIRIDAINRSDAPAPGTIKAYLDSLSQKGIPVKNQDLGYELSNVETDKIVVGAQEVGMYLFDASRDRDIHEVKKRNMGIENGVEFFEGAQWSLETMLKQQILPFYGFLGKDAVTIPRGFGSYQQIMLDANGLNAFGVGNYYIATEMELRAASISYEAWRNFLLQYNDAYVTELSGFQDASIQVSKKITEVVDNIEDIINNYEGDASPWINSEFGVSVPRCVFNSDKNYMGSDGLPANRCAPPFGYPLYYQRASAIGIPEAGYVFAQASLERMVANFGTDTVKLDEYKKWAKTKVSEIDDLITKFQNKFWLRNKWHWNNWDEENAYNQLLKRKKKIQETISYEENRLTFIQNKIKNSSELYRAAQKSKASSLKNAKKIYEFIKNVADKHLGKTFLIKIPKACNVFFSDSIELWNSKDPSMSIKRGPLGFKPQSTNSNIGYYANNSIENDININIVRSLISESDYFHHYIYNPKGAYYTTGALKNNFNPISDKWEFNYEPEPQGGFLNYGILGAYNLLLPQDMTNFIEDGRMQCYVRFNNSQYLDFSKISSDNFAQQVYSSEGFIPDIIGDLDNVSFDNRSSFDRDKELIKLDQPKSVAFVKCSVEPKFYMAPKTINAMTKVWARKINFSPNVGELKVIETQEYKTDPDTGSFILDSNGNKIVEKTIKSVESSIHPVFWIKNGGSDGAEVLNSDFVRYYDEYTNSYLVDANYKNLDPDNVYAIITLPSMITSNIQQRYVDSVITAANLTSFKNLMTADVVKGVEGFEKPAYKRGLKVDKDDILTGEVTINGKKYTAMDLYKEQIRTFAMSNVNVKLSFIAPSPVYPDLIALPLMSKERCYGPWVSTSVANSAGDARLRYSDIGGKVDFVKEENLAPWTYGGYQLMNEAGSLMAQFSNSLLLYSERGGFVIPDAPLGISLAKALQAGGPLVTSISVDVSSSEVSTTIKMDLYTSKFGKLQKQKEKAIGFINRERQKIIDKNNADVRRGMGKNKSNANNNQKIMNSVVNLVRQVSSTFIPSNLEGSKNKTNKIIVDATNQVSSYQIIQDQAIAAVNFAQQNNNIIQNTDFSIIGTIDSMDNFLELQELYPDFEEIYRKNTNTAIVDIGDQFSIVPITPHHPDLRSMEDSNDANIILQRNIGYS